VAKLVRRLTLDQEIKGSNPFSPANVLSQDIVDSFAPLFGGAAVEATGQASETAVDPAEFERAG
jgi:hypothetical protein